MQKFKIGDKVKVVNDTYTLSKCNLNKIGIIEDYNLGAYTVKFDNCSHGKYLEDCIELTDLLKIGDIVTYTYKNVPYEGKISAVNPKCGNITFDYEVNFQQPYKFTNKGIHGVGANPWYKLVRAIQINPKEKDDFPKFKIGDVVTTNNIFYKGKSGTISFIDYKHKTYRVILEGSFSDLSFFEREITLKENKLALEDKLEIGDFVTTKDTGLAFDGKSGIVIRASPKRDDFCWIRIGNHIFDIPKVNLIKGSSLYGKMLDDNTISYDINDTQVLIYNKNNFENNYIYSYSREELSVKSAMAIAYYNYCKIYCS